MSRSLSLLLVSALTFASPLSVMAGGTPVTPSSVSTQDILNAVDPSADTSVTSEPVAAPMPADGKGGGGGGAMNSSLYYPGTISGGVQVSAEIVKTVTPDFIAINAYCDSGKQATRQAVRDLLQQLYTDIKNFVGKDGRVRKSGPVSAYPYYDTNGTLSDSFSGNLNIFVRITNKNRAQEISDYIEQKNCSVNWDVRLVNTQTHELSILDELASQLNTRKTVFEKLLKKRLNTISSASLSTWVDGYGTYDPDSNTVDATTTLSVTYDIGGRTTIPTPTPMTK